MKSNKTKHKWKKIIIAGVIIIVLVVAVYLIFRYSGQQTAFPIPEGFSSGAGGS